MLLFLRSAMTIATAAVLVLGVPGVGGADVRVHRPEIYACFPDPIKVGVRYVPRNHGPTWFRIVVRERHEGSIIFSKRGHASPHWRYWGVHPQRHGRFIVSYRIPGRNKRYELGKSPC